VLARLDQAKSQRAGSTRTIALLWRRNAVYLLPLVHLGNSKRTFT
jgi:hypothetical protein